MSIKFQDIGEKCECRGPAHDSGRKSPGQSGIRTIALAVSLALANAACQEEKPEPKPAAAVDIWPYKNGPSAEPAPQNQKDFADAKTKLRDRYGKEAADFAVRITQNGSAIRANPRKEKLYRIHDEIQKRFPNIHIPKLFGFFDETREAENAAQLFTAWNKVINRAKKDGVKLPLTFVVSALCNEGFSLDMDHFSSGTASGFSGFGLDVFGDEFKKLVAAGYLPKEFRSRFTVREHMNEKGKRVRSADFSNKEAAFEAFVATLAYRQNHFLDHVRQQKIPLHKVPDELVLFATYKLYNGGGTSRRALFENKNLKALMAYFRDVTPAGSSGNAYGVLTGHLWLTQSGAFDLTPKLGEYWWAERS